VQRNTGISPLGWSRRDYYLHQSSNIFCVGSAIKRQQGRADPYRRTNKRTGDDKLSSMFLEVVILIFLSTRKVRFTTGSMQATDWRVEENGHILGLCVVAVGWRERRVDE
jgi:hypothetical protein